MPLARVRSAVVVGVQGRLVEVEVDITAGLPGMSIVGLPDTAVGEARDRTRAAVGNSGLPWPRTRITVGLSPAALPKRGASLDLAIATGVLAAQGEVPSDAVRGLLVVGELGLDGRVRPVPGVLVAALEAARLGLDRVAVPAANAQEAALVPGLAVLPVRRLRDLVAFLRGVEPEPDDLPDEEGPGDDQLGAAPEPLPDLRDVRGHAMARNGLEIAAAGGHHLAMLGAPGVGKTLLAERLPGLLPELTRDEALEVTAVHSVAGRLPPGSGLVTRPPMAAPHHTSTLAAMVGGGSGSVPRVGLVSTAHRGVLFLDEAPEFDPTVLDSLRQPIESGRVTVARAGFVVTLPARFLLVLAANPCPCGRAYERATSSLPPCSCGAAVRRRYLSRISGPLLDRVDLRLVLERPTAAELRFGESHAEPTAVVAARVRDARARAARRLRGTPWSANGEVPGPVLRRSFPPAADAVGLLDDLLRSPTATARGADRVARIAWTVADLAGRDRPGRDDVMHANGLRSEGAAWAA
jgi:magnesium chelatase family protein